MDDDEDEEDLPQVGVFGGGESGGSAGEDPQHSGGVAAVAWSVSSNDYIHVTSLTPVIFPCLVPLPAQVPLEELLDDLEGRGLDEEGEEGGGDEDMADA
jgi:hypothetical protein